MIKATCGKIVGLSHAHEKTPCQDAVAIKLKSNGGCIALSDGAGSRQLSHLGSAILTERMADFGVNNFEKIHDLVIRKSPKAIDLVIDPLLVCLRGAVRRKSIEIDALAATLMFFSCDGDRFIAGHIGDGAIFIRDSNGVKLLSEPENGEYSNITYFITDKNAKQKLRLYSGVIGKCFGAMVMSDGTAESLFDKKLRKPGAAANRIFQWSDELPMRKMSKVIAGNLKHSFQKKTSDDCSIAVMTRS